MPVLFSNNASTTLAAGITNSATSITVASGQGALFPTLSGTNYFLATLSNSSNVLEIVKVTARSGDVMTVQRAFDNTVASPYNTGDKFELRPTAFGLNNKIDVDYVGTLTGTFTFNGGTTTFTNAVAINGALSGTGVNNIFASPPAAIGTGVPVAITGTTITANTGFSGPINGIIGGGTPAAGTFTQITVNGANLSTSIAPTGTGTVTLNPATAGTINNMSVGVTTPAAGKFTQAYTLPVVVTFSATAMSINCALSNVFTIAMTASVTTAMTMTGQADGQTINVFITQDGTRTMTWPATTIIKWAGGTAPTLSTAATSVDLLVMTYRSATSLWYGQLTKNFA
jgi:hypothetical protein